MNFKFDIWAKLQNQTHNTGIHILDLEHWFGLAGTEFSF